MVDKDATDVEFPEVTKKFFKAIESIPGKARHEGFQMAVVGRMPFNWINLWLQGISFILAARIAPKVIMEMTRVPIGKGPDKPGETRPLALVHGTWISSTQSSTKIWPER